MTLPTRQQVASAYAEIQRSLREGTTALTQESLAEISETSTAYQQRLERGTRCPNLWIFIKIAIALGVDPALMLKMTLARLRRDL